jgi:hypothetical protein
MSVVSAELEFDYFLHSPVVKMGHGQLVAIFQHLKMSQELSNMLG